MTQWSIDKARQTYNIAHWSNGYFDINEAGHLVAKPDRQQSIDLYQLSKEIKDLGLSLPVLVRFSDILNDRVDTLTRAFAKAKQRHDYQGHYTAVYPIKVNQQRSVVQAILERGIDSVGLEAGSKPELLAVLAQIPVGGVVVCNGYKDREYIRLALIGLSLGMRVTIVVEKPSELELILDESARLGITPVIGVRARLASISAGKWQNSGGEKAKFGLAAAQILELVQRLAQVGKLDCLQMLHFHLGSQIANIRDIQRGMQECARFYAELRRLGAGIQCVNVGGGLGVDYEGTRSRSACSMNYSAQEYANNIVHALWEVCQAQALPQPAIISESGRAITAHHALLITNVIDSECVPHAEGLSAPAADAPQLLQDLWQRYQALGQRPLQVSVVEAYHDAVHWLSEAHGLYSHGVLGLEQRAQAEGLYFAICRQVQALLHVGRRSQRTLLDELNEKLADKYFCNFSLFQSMPDVWAIQQIFPVVPLHRLEQAPTRRAVLEDITCDSDGRIDHYVDSDGIESSLPLHQWNNGEQYLLGIFGAYQEILGDMHNLFGDTDSVHVRLDGKGGYRLDLAVRGDSVDTVLRYVHFNPEDLLQLYQAKIESAPGLSEAQRQDYFAALSEGMRGYTYLED